MNPASTRRRALSCIAGAVMIATVLTAQAAVADDRSGQERPHGRVVAWDVAIDCRTFRFNGGMSFDTVGRGDTFIANGRLFPAGSIAPGAQANDPNDPGSIGRWVERGTMAATLAEIVGGALPAFYATWYHFPDDGSVLVADGAHPDSGPMAVIGGTGRFSDAGGELADEIIGWNSTGCPNLRETITLEPKVRK
jgi:hypothetical protein